MGNNQFKVYHAKTISDILYHLRNVNNVSITAGCTGIMYKKNPEFLTYPDSILNIRNVEELSQINKTERFIEFGSCVTFSQIQGIESKHRLSILQDAIRDIGTPSVRNIATLGGNLCLRNYKMTAFAPLLALDAKLEFRNINDIQIIPIKHFHEVPTGSFLSKIRIPVEDWDVAIFRRVGPLYEVNDFSAGYVFLANTQKDILSDLRISFCFKHAFRSKELENLLIGNKLPLSDKTILSFIEKTSTNFDEYMQNNKIECNTILKEQFINLLGASLEKLT